MAKKIIKKEEEIKEENKLPGGFPEGYDPDLPENKQRWLRQ